MRILKITDISALNSILNKDKLYITWGEAYFEYSSSTTYPTLILLQWKRTKWQAKNPLFDLDDEYFTPDYCDFNPLIKWFIECDNIEIPIGKI